MLKELSKNKGGLLGSSLKVLSLKVVGILIYFIISLLLTNNFNAYQVGRYDFARSILLVLGGICLLGTNQSIIYYSGYLKAKNSLESLKKVYLKMVGIICVVAFFFLLLRILIHDEFFDSIFEKPDASEVVFMVVISLLLYAWAILNIDMIRAMGNTVMSEFFRNVLRYLPFLIIIFILTYNDIKGVLVEAYLLSFLILWITSSLYILFKLRTIKSASFEKITLKSIVSNSYPMAVSAISYFMLQSTDIILLGRFESYNNVAYYSVAVKLATITTLSLMSVNVVIAPRIAELHTRNQKNELQETLKNSSRLIFGLNFLAVMVMIVFSDFVISLFGAEYIEAKNSLFILLFAQLISSLCGTVGIYMNMTGQQKVLQRFLITALFLNILLNWLLIPRYSLIGAAFATSISVIFWNIAGAVYLYVNESIKTYLN